MDLYSLEYASQEMYRHGIHAALLAWKASAKSVCCLLHFHSERLMLTPDCTYVNTVAVAAHCRHEACLSVPLFTLYYAEACNRMLF